MGWRWFFLAAALSVSALAADEPRGVTSLPCAPASNSACNPSKQNLKKAKAAFEKALKLEKAKRTDEAYDQFDRAARLVPKKPVLTSLSSTMPFSIPNFT